MTESFKDYFEAFYELVVVGSKGDAVILVHLTDVIDEISKHHSSHLLLKV
jgi:hypothetical protein